MKLSLPWFALLTATILLQFSETNGCFPEEKRALLDFKVTLFNQSLLPSWVDDPQSNCCVWERVTCDSSSHHVTHLSLGSVYDDEYGSCFSNLYPLNLNWDLFLSFNELRSLNLSCIGLYGIVRKGDYKSKSPLKKLETLDLSWNNLNETTLEFLNDLPSLKNLILALNDIRGLFPMKELSLLPNLELLDLSWNKLYITTEDYRSKSPLKKLETLDLSGNNLNETTLEFLNDLPSLKNLNLAANDIRGPFPMKELSLLPNLELLDLSGNGLNSTFTTQDYKSKSPLKKLETLDLSWNNLNETTWEFLTALPSLKNLILARNEIGGPFPMKELSLLPNLELLDLSWNKLNSSFTTQDYRSKSPLKKLETLDLSGNNLNETMLEFLNNLPSLKNLILADNYIGGPFPMKELSLLPNLELLDLSMNELYSTTEVLANLSKLEVLKLYGSFHNGSFPNQGLCKMKQLQELDMSYNDFSGTLDTCLYNLTSLRILDLSYNSLTGSIPTPLITRLASLEHLSLSYNAFDGLFSLNILGNHSELKVLELGSEKSKTLQVETENSQWNASFQLERLIISHCQVNLPTKRIPTFLSYQNGLRYIDLSGNNLVGRFPSWLLVNNPKLVKVNLNDNSFSGPFELPSDLIHHMDQVYELDLSFNQFQGELPNNIGFFFPHLEYLDVSSNMFDGLIPASIGEMSGLWGLNLGHNNFSGKVPENILNGCISLSFLKMDNNKLNGSLPSGIGKLRLDTLIASRNNFEGTIPRELCQLELTMLDLSHNKLYGPLPSCLEMPLHVYLRGNNLTSTITKALVNNSDTDAIPERNYRPLLSLRFLLLAGNQLQGELSNQICKLQNIQILDLSHNNFTGSIPSCINIWSFGDKNDTIYGDEEVQFVMKGVSLLYKRAILGEMSGIDLSSNQLTGEIPDQIGDLHALYALNLSHNHLKGSIPESFKKLENIESLDLSNNNLSGQIPLPLQDLHYLSVFNVCNNNLSGIAPDKGQFGTFDESSYKGNPYLSWSNSNRGIARLPPPPTPLNDEDKNDSTIDFTSFYWSFAGSYIMVIIALVTILWINPYWRRAWFHFVGRFLDKCFGRYLKDAFY